jgi:TetR/AcrR family transcriptional regulator, mexCD-oprJ operon repressor
LVTDNQAREYAWGVPQGTALHDRARTAILDAAAIIFAEQSESASLADVALAAGVARSTLYRYFPTREALLTALAEAGASEVASRLAEVLDDSIPVPEALARVTRALLAIGVKYVALTVLRPKIDDGTDSEVAGRLVELFRRGIDDGTLRKNLDPEALAAIYGDLINGAITRSTRGGFSAESASVLIVSVLLNGARQKNR